VGHHVTECGNRRCDVFVDDADRRLYLSLPAEYAEPHGLAVSAYCLMTNPVHFVATPSATESLGRTFRAAHQADAAEVRLLQRRRTRTGRPCGGEAFVRGPEALLGRRRFRRKPGPKPKRTA
jgi:putative transposase